MLITINSLPDKMFRNLITMLVFHITRPDHPDPLPGTSALQPARLISYSWFLAEECQVLKCRYRLLPDYFLREEALNSSISLR